MQKKIIITITLIVAVISAGLGINGYIVLNESIDRSLQDRIALAGIIAKNIDLLLEKNLNRLYDISLSGRINLKDNDFGPEIDSLSTAYSYSIFTDGIFLLDRDGNVILNYPEKMKNIDLNLLSIPYVSRIIMDGKPVISDVYTVEPVKKKVIYALAPLKDKDGSVAGVIGGEIDPTNLRFNEIIKSVHPEPNTYIEIIDSRGVVIASNNPERIFTCNDHNRFLENLTAQKKSGIRKCHRCHFEKGMQSPGGSRSTDILAYAPLETAPWGVSIFQPEKDVFAPARKMNKTFLLISIGSVMIALIIAIGMGRSIIKPVHELINASQEIASGDLSKPIVSRGKDEIGMLSGSFEVMRVELANSLNSLQQCNVQLEQRVIERTRQIQDSQRKVENLLGKIISAEEDERKRIARGLHDETMQSLSALLMKIDMCKLYPDNPSACTVDEMKRIVFSTLDGIHAIIQNLRPTILDDMGLESAIPWLLDKYLGGKGITCFFNAIGPRDGRLSSRTETLLFRIIQESIINISRHAGAKNVFVILRYSKDSLTVDIEDDGEGFDTASALIQTEGGRGLGILGMKERAYLLDGKLQVCSMPDSGTRVSLRIPLGDKDV